MKLYFMRHGQTEWNLTGRLQGQSDIPLNDTGKQLAMEQSEKQKNLKIDVIYSSPLCRALETATIMKRDRKIPLIMDERIKEISFGEAEGCVSGRLEYNREQAHPAFHNFFHDPIHYEPPKGAESFQQLFNRTESFLNEIMKKPDLQDKTVLVVAHGACIRGLLHYFHPFDVSEFWGKELGPIGNCDIIKVL